MEHLRQLLDEFEAAKADFEAAEAQASQVHAEICHLTRIDGRFVPPSQDKTIVLRYLADFALLHKAHKAEAEDLAKTFTAAQALAREASKQYSSAIRKL